MSTAIDLGAISASVALDLSKLRTDRAQVSAELSGISSALDRLATQAEVDGKRIAAATFSREEQAALKKQEAALKAQAAQAQALRTAAVNSFTGIAAGITLAGIAAVKMSADFESSMTKISNNTTMTAADIVRMKQTVIALGKESGASFDELGQGFMHIVNFGFKATEATTILREAMKSAVATGSSVADTADILAKSLHEFGLKATDAGHAMNVMHLAAAQGNMTLQQFDQAAGPAFAQAANLGVGLTDVSAAMSALTRHGLDASEAATQVKDILVHMINPSKSAREELEKLSEKTGINLVADFSQAGLKAKGLTGVLDDLARATGGNGQEIYKLIQAQRGGLGAMILAGTGAKDYKDILASLTDAMTGKVDPATTGYEKSLKNLNTQIARITNEIKADFIPVGEKLTPVFEAAIPVIHGTAQVLGEVLDVFDELPQPLQEAILAVGGLKLGSIALNMALGTLGGTLPSLISGIGKMGGAFGGVTAAEGLAAEEGASAFAAGGPWGLAIGAAVLLIGGIAIAWKQAADAQDSYASKKISDKAAVNTSDTRTNIGNQSSQNSAEADRQQSLLDKLRATPNGVMLPRDPSQGRYADTVSAEKIGGRGGMSVAAVDQLRAQQMAMLTRNIAALRADTSALTVDGATTSDIGNKKRNYQREVENATRSQAQITTRLQELDHAIAGFAGVHINSTKAQQALNALTSERAAQQNNYNALERDKQKNQRAATYFGKLERADTAKHGGVGGGTQLGTAIAEIAWRKQIGLDRAAYADKCQVLARETVQAITPAFDKYFAGSARETIENFKKAGLAQKYIPGQALPVGSLLYSETMGKRGGKIDGHVQVVGPGGHRYDQHGEDQFALKNFQYFVPPPGTKASTVTAAAQSGGYKAPVDPDAVKERSAFLLDQKDQLYEAGHGKWDNLRHEARRDRDKADADPSATGASKAVAQQVYLAKKKEINADEKKEQKAHYAELLRQWRQHLAEVKAAQQDDLKRRLGIKAGAAKNHLDLANLSADITGNTDALSGDPETVQFGKNRAEAAKRLRERQDKISSLTTLGPYGKNDIDPGTLRKQAQAEYDAAIKHIQEQEAAKKARDQADADEKVQREKDKSDRVIEEADRAAEKQRLDIEETARFEYEQGMISLAQYQAFLKAKLASTQQWADASHTILNRDWMAAKSDYDASLGDKKQKPGNDPLSALTGGMIGDAGKGLEAALDGGKGKLHGLKAEVKDWEDSTIKAIKHVAAMWAMSSLFGSKFGGGFNFGGGGQPKPSAVGGAAAAPLLTSFGSKVPSVQFGSGVHGLSGNLLGAVPQIQGINGAIGGLGKGTFSGSLGSGMDLASMLASFLPGGGLLSGLLGKGGGILGGLGKIFHFATGGLVPGVGHHDSVAAMLTPGERVLTKEQQAGMGGNQIIFNHHGDVHGIEDMEAVQRNFAWSISQQLPTAVPGN